MATKEAQKTLEYKGHPLLRSGNEFYYGSMEKSHVVFMQILSFDEVDGKEVAGKVHVQLLSNNPSLTPQARIVKESDKNGLYNALDIGYIWLERALSGK
jgi:predicted GNAT family N-acyltransferase